MICGLLGGKLGGTARYMRTTDTCGTGPEELDAFFADRSWTGVNVTIPYKRAAMKYCDVIASARCASAA